MRIAFAGTPDFAVPALAALAASGHELVGVLTQPDRPAGRGQQLSASPIKEFALAHGLSIDQPRTLRTSEGRVALERWRPDVLVVVAYGLILPAEVLALPRHGCLNIHASLLPRWRGAAPIQRALLAGDDSTGISWMVMDAGLDTGPLLDTQSLPILPQDDSQTLHARLAELGASRLVPILEEWAAGTRVAQPQANQGVTYAKKIDKAEARIDWQAPAIVIERQVRAFRPWPIAETLCAGEQLRIHRACTIDSSPVTASAPGSVLGLQDEALVIACGTGRLGLLEVQRAGRRVISAKEFFRSLSSDVSRLG